MKKYHPTLFTTPMVQAIDLDRKNTTRRIVDPQPVYTKDGKLLFKGRDKTTTSMINECKYSVGDILWVRETFMDADGDFFYRAQMDAADQAYFKGDWKPSLFMPKEACRIFLEVIKVRIERLQQITDADAIQEGLEVIYVIDEKHKVYKNYLLKKPLGSLNPIRSFSTLWDSIYAKRKKNPLPWASNPFVWVIEFKKVLPPEGWPNV